MSDVLEFSLPDGGEIIASPPQVMQNGELRARMTAGDGAWGFIYTQASDDSGWQNAHYHMGVRETYIVLSGEMVFADQLGDERRVRKFGPGDVVTSEPTVPHNVWLSPGAKILTLKYGTAVGNPLKGGADWYDADPAFDEWTKSLVGDALEEALAASM